MPLTQMVTLYINIPLSGFFFCLDIGYCRTIILAFHINLVIRHFDNQIPQHYFM